jgi:hypothetical protein
MRRRQARTWPLAAIGKTGDKSATQDSDDLRNNLQVINAAGWRAPVIAKRAAEQMGGHDRYALGVSAAAVDVGAVDAQQRGRTGAEQPAERLGFPIGPLQGAVQAAVVVPHQPVGALVDAAGPLLAVDHGDARGTDGEVVHKVSGIARDAGIEAEKLLLSGHARRRRGRPVWSLVAADQRSVGAGPIRCKIRPLSARGWGGAAGRRVRRGAPGAGPRGGAAASGGRGVPGDSHQLEGNDLCPESL